MTFRTLSLSLVATAVTLGCTTLPAPAELDAQADAMIKAGFRA